MPDDPRRDRASWPIAVYRLGEEPGDNLRDVTTASERFEMVWTLSARMWEWSGGGPPGYTRESMPIRVVPQR